MLLLFLNPNTEDKQDELNFEIDERGEPVFMALLDDNSIFYFYMNYQNIGASYYRYYFNSDEIVEIGDISNFYLDVSSYVKVGDKLYFYVAEAESNTEICNALYYIDIQDNTLHFVAKDEDSVPGLYISNFDDAIVSLKNVRKGNEIITYLDFYHINSKKWDRKLETSFNEVTKEGSALYVCHSDGEFLYVIEDMYHNKICNTVLRKYDKNMKVIKEINLDSDDLQYVLREGRITNIYVFQDYIYIVNTAMERFLGKIKENSVKTILLAESLFKDMNLYEKDISLFYLSNKNVVFELNLQTEIIKEKRLNIDKSKDLTIHLIMSNRENMFLILTDGNFENHYYFIKKEKFENYIFQ